MEIYLVYDKNPQDEHLRDIRACFTEQEAQAEVRRQEKKGREAACETFIPRCTWGTYSRSLCQNEATWFEVEFEIYGAVCDEHYYPAWMTRHLQPEEKIRRELGFIT